MTRFIRFVASGAAGTSVHYGIFLVLCEIAPLGAGPAAGIGAAAGAVVNYALARWFVFDTHVAHTTAVPKFAAMAGFAILANGVSVAVLTAAGLHYVVAQVLTTAALLAFNFLVSSLWIFRSSRSRS
jgi:putative flippase GtrA